MLNFLDSQTFTTGTTIKYYWHDHFKLQFLNDWKKKTRKHSSILPTSYLQKKVFFHTPVRLTLFITTKYKKNVEIPSALDTRISKFHSFRNQKNVSLHRRVNLCNTLHLHRTSFWKLNIALVRQFVNLFTLYNVLFVCCKYNNYCRQNKLEGN